MKKTEVNKLLKYLRNSGAGDPRRIGILLALYAGLNIGEICALTWHDVDLRQMAIYVDKTAARTMKSQTEASRVEVSELDDERMIPINHQLEKWIFACRPVEAQGYVLSNTSKIVESRNLQNYLTSTLKKAGIPKYSFAQIRETFIVYALKNGAEVSVLANVLGVTTSVLESKYSDYLTIRYCDKMRAVEKVFY